MQARSFWSPPRAAPENLRWSMHSLQKFRVSHSPFLRRPAPLVRVKLTDANIISQVREHFPEAVSIFILPPSIQALEDRLHKRGQDSEQTITRRLLGAGAEMAHASEFDFVIINSVFENALNEFCAIVTASRLRFDKQAARCRDIFIQLGIPN